jgi:hypothetical protein
MRYIHLLILTLLFMGPSALRAGEMPRQVSLVRLLANPEDYDGKAVIVAGYLCTTGPMEYGLFLDRLSCEDRHFGNAVGLDVARVSKRLPKRATLLTVEGTFRSLADYIQTDAAYTWGSIDASNVSGRTLP